MRPILPFLLAALLTTACASSGDGANSAIADSGGFEPDTAAPFDFGADVGATTPDVTPFADVATGDLGADIGSGGTEPLPGFGEISGDCGVLDTELTSGTPHFFRNTLDFGTDPYDDADAARLTDGGREIIADGNAGGNSLLSEIFAYEVLARCEGAMLLKTETEVEYQNPMGKLTDLLVEMDEIRIGVSVTRAIAFPFEDPYTAEQAEALLADKLADIQLSSANVAAADAWQKQVLHVIAYSPMHADSLRTAYEALDPAVLADTVVYVTVTDGDDAPLY